MIKTSECPICPKCKKDLRPCSHHMMGIDKKCFNCGVCWTKAHGFKVFPVRD